MNERDFLKLVDRLVAEGDVPREQHEYFRGHQTRLISTLSLLGLWQPARGSVLEIGPFFAYTPFLYREQGNEVAVLEGTDPVIEPLLELYRTHGIRCDQLNMLRVFAGPSANVDRLPYGSASFDRVICFETMEHFSFNPVAFVRELSRIMKPGGRAYITVPNQAKLVNRLRLLFGRSVRTPIDDYYTFADYNGGEFLGFHWREYTLGEVVELFSKSGFHVELATHHNSFIDRDDASFGRRLKRALGQLAIAAFPDMAQNCVLILRKS